MRGGRREKDDGIEQGIAQKVVNVLGHMRAGIPPFGLRPPVPIRAAQPANLGSR
jgi:hypothetical protein